jgi:hypothetical protein
MPKDNSHISHFSRREHTPLREQAHTRRHQLHIQNLSPLKGINWCGAGLTASVEADLGTRERTYLGTVVRTREWMLTRCLEVEVCFSALSLNALRGEGTTMSEAGQGVAEMTSEQGGTEPMEGGASVGSL